MSPSMLSSELQYQPQCSRARYSNSVAPIWLFRCLLDMPCGAEMGAGEIRSLLGSPFVGAMEKANKREGGFSHRPDGQLQPTVGGLCSHWQCFSSLGDATSDI